MMYRLFTCLLTVIVALAAEAQIDYKLYFANNVGDLARISKIKANDSGLKWTEITDGTVSGNRTDVEAVKNMFREEHNLRMMVKLLEECGFVDVNVFEELQPIKQEKNVS